MKYISIKVVDLLYKKGSLIFKSTNKLVLITIQVGCKWLTKSHEVSMQKNKIQSSVFYFIDRLNNKKC